MSKLDPAVIEEIRERRLVGESVESISQALGVATGSVSRYGGKVKRVGASQVSAHEERPKLFPSADKLPFDAEALELANRLRRERLQEELDGLEFKRQTRSRNAEMGTEMDQLRLREREIFLKLNQGTGTGETVQLRAQVLALSEQRHNLELSMLEARLSGQIAMLRAGQSNVGKYDIINRGMDKVESLGLMIGSKIDKLSLGSDFSQALALGLSPQEYSLLKQGPPLPPMSKAKWTEGFKTFSNVYAKKLEGQESPEVDQSVLDLEYLSYVSDQQLQVENYEKIMTKISGRGGNQVTAPTAPVLTGKTNVISLKCSFCNEVIAIDLLDAKLRQTRAGKCPNCRATVDLRSYFPAAPQPKPEEDLPSGWGNPGDEPR